MPLKELAGLTAEGAFLNKKHTYSYGAHAAHITVDPKLGRIEIVDYVVVQDVGRAINPLTLRGQVIGSLVQGLGGAVLEDLQYDENGQFLTGSLADYLLPTASDFPNLRCVVLDDYPSPINPLGAKGAGEGGIIAAGGVHGERGGECAAIVRRRAARTCRCRRPISGSWCRPGAAQGGGVARLAPSCTDDAAWRALKRLRTHPKPRFAATSRFDRSVP